MAATSRNRAGRVTRLSARETRIEALLEGLAQLVEHHRGELPELVEEQNSAVGEGDLARSDPRRAPTDHRHRAHPVVGCPQRWPAHQAAGEREAGCGMDPGGLQRLVVVELGEETGEALGQHRLARAGRTDHQQVVTSGGSHLDRGASQRVAPHVGEVGRRGLGRLERAVGERRPRGLGGHGLDQGLQGRARVRTRWRRNSDGLGSRVRRDDDLVGHEGVDERQRARHVAERAVETELADERPLPHRLDRNLPAGHQHADGDGQIERAEPTLRTLVGARLTVVRRVGPGEARS